MHLPQLPTWLVGLAIGAIVAAGKIKARPEPAPPKKLSPIADAERRILELDGGTPNLGNLKSAIELLARVLQKDLEIDLSEQSVLLVRNGLKHTRVAVSDGLYHVILTHCADMYEERHTHLEFLAWRIAGHMHLPRHLAAAKERLERERGSKVGAISLTEIAREQAKEYRWEGDLCRRLTRS